MKHLFFLIVLTSCALQMGLFAQPPTNAPAHQLEVQMQQVPTDRGSSVRQQQPQQQPPQQQQQDSNDTQDDEGDNDDNDDNSDQNGQKVERTLSILKPDALRNRHIGDIIARFENSGLHVIGLKMVKLSKEQASQFYNIHRDRPFFTDLVNSMSSGPVVILVLEGNNAINKNRQLMGATDPKKADKGTIRADYAKSVSENSVHGSDSPTAAREEINFFFQPNELYSGY